MKISAVLCTLNEDHYLDECLKSLAFADEIVLCDRGSVDRTLEIAREHECKIFKVENAGFIELLRQTAVDHCTNEWICFVDPDFILPEDAFEFIKREHKSDAEVTCFSMKYINHYQGKPIWHGRWGAGGSYPIIFRRDAMKLLPVLHSGYRLKYGKVKTLPKSIYIKHMWIRDNEHFFEKHKRYIENEGLGRLSLGHEPSIGRTTKIIRSLIFRYLFDGILDGARGYDLFRKSIWYEVESERKLAQVFKLDCACPICGAVIDKPSANLYDDRYGYPGNFLLAECTSCGHKHLRGDFTSSALSRLYTDYYPRSNFSLDSHKPHQELENRSKAWLDGAKRSAFRWVPKGVRVLDIGCGFGNSLGYYRSIDCDAYGVEADENIRRVADKFGYNVYVGVFDPAAYQPNYFDYVTLDQVVEHATAPVQFLADVAQVLKPGGTAIISTPNAQGWGAGIFGRRWINWHAPYHLQFFGKKSMGLAAEKAGLVLEKQFTITSSEWLLYQWVHLLNLPRMGNPSIFWNPSSKASKKREIIIKLIGYFHKTKINHMITRFFDILNIGDNYVFVLRKKDESGSVVSETRIDRTGAPMNSSSVH